VKAFQDVHLRRLVLHAYENVPYYRRLFDRNRLHPRHIRGTVDLDLIPISSKQAMRERPVHELLDRTVDQRKLLTVCTSGSAGEPFTIRRTWLEQAFNVLFQMRSQQSFGLRLPARVMTVGRGVTIRRTPSWWAAFARRPALTRRSTSTAWCSRRKRWCASWRRSGLTSSWHCRVSYALRPTT